MENAVSPAAKSRILMEALPYLRQFSGETIVIKYGGNAMIDETLKKAFALNIALLKYVGLHPVVVHGGGPQIGEMLNLLDIPSNFKGGLRVTDDATMDVVEMVLVGKVNKQIVNLLNLSGAKAVGLSGKDGQLLKARKKEMRVDNGVQPPEIIDLGNVGEVVGVETSLIRGLQERGFVPVIAPVGVDENGKTYNINADSVAGAVAKALRAKRLLILTDVAGILDKQKELIKFVSVAGVRELFDNGTITGGMIPKVECCINAMDDGAETATILDGRVENCVLLELFTEYGVGTQFLKEKVEK